MKIKLFLSASLAVLGLWLAAAFLHTVDVASYQAQPAELKAAQVDDEAVETTEEPVIETASLR
jgi:hypothetical protein